MLMHRLQEKETKYKLNVKNKVILLYNKYIYTYRKHAYKQSNT